MKNKTLTLLLYIFCGILFTSCTKTMSTGIDKDNWLTLSDQKVNLNVANEYTYTVTVDAKTSWTAISDNDWVTVEPAKGDAGTTQVKIIYAETDIDDSGHIIFRSSLQDLNEKEIDVTIEKREWLIPSENDVRLDIVNDNAIITVDAITDWIVSSASDWIVVEPSTGKAGITQVKITSKLRDEEKTGSVTFKSRRQGLDEIDINVFFDNREWLTISEPDVTLNIVNDYAIITVDAMTDWTVSSSSEWLTVEPSDGTAGTTQIKITSALEKDMDNSSKLVFKSKKDIFNDFEMPIKICDVFDDKFEQVLISKEISLKTVNTVIGLNVSFKKLSSLKGIEYFESLTKLLCFGNELTHLDISRNTKLTELNCWMNKLTSLDVSKNTELTSLDCCGNQLTSLDVNKNTNLTDLDCSANQLTSLDVSKSTNLTTLDCAINELTYLNISGNTKLKELICWDNELPNLDISKNIKLYKLICRQNPGNGNKFPVKAWFDNNTIPKALEINRYEGSSANNLSWQYGSRTITIDFYK